MKLSRLYHIAIVIIAITIPALATAANTELTWYGHAAFKVKIPSGKVILIDPWITNPANKTGKEDLAGLDKVDLILITHGHSDHVGNSVDIAKKTGAKLVSTFDLGKSLTQYSGYPKEQMGYDTQGNFGGELTLLDGEVKIAFIPAIHSSTAVAPDSSTDKDIHDGGNPGGFLITVKNGPSIYHTGDTDVFTDMALISQFHKVDVMLACIGGHFTMGPARAAEAAKLVNPTQIIPMHYGTFPILKGTPAELATALKKLNIKTQLNPMQIGETRKL